MRTIKLERDVFIPILGLGTWRLNGNIGQKAIEEALFLGYRHIDTADYYGNHEEVGKAVKSSGVKRENIFITTKLPPHKLRKSGVEENVKRYLKELQTNYIDLLLIHWPNPSIDERGALDIFDKLKRKGIIKTYGVSNFNMQRLKRALNGGYKIRVNQVKYNPTNFDDNLKEFCDKNKVVVTAYTPLGKGADFNLPAVKELSEKYSKTPAQIILNWIISKGIVAIPKAEKKQHLEENLGALGWNLDKKDIEKIG